LIGNVRIHRFKNGGSKHGGTEADGEEMGRGSKVGVVVTDQDSKMAKLIRESRWNVKHNYDANHAKRALNPCCQVLPKEEQQLLYGLGKRSRDWSDHVVHQPIYRDKKVEMWENTLNQFSGDHSKCHHPAHQGYQWKNRDMPEAQASL
jgi:hypothetical protein